MAWPARRPEELVVEVYDHSSARPVPRPGDPDNGGGFGWGIARQPTSPLTALPHRTGKSVRAVWQRAAPGHGKPVPGGPGRGARAIGAPGLGARAIGTPAVGAPARGCRALGSPALARPALGAPALGSPAPR